MRRFDSDPRLQILAVKIPMFMLVWRGGLTSLLRFVIILY
jgi:hypothetical protein